MLVVDESAPAGPATCEAAALLQTGALVAFPTESFYGLGAVALDSRSTERVLHVKGRPDHKPLLVIVDSVDMVESLAEEIPERARELMRRYWPGPLTLVLRASPHVPTAVTAGTGTIGVRIPGNPVALALVRATGRPVTAPSANPNAAPPPTSAEDVRRYFDGRIDLILDGGTTAGGSGSTVADCTVWPPRVLRAGPIAI